MSKISILIPAKNTAHFLPECLDSIIEQKEKNWEVLIVNDHSTDNTWEVLQAYEKRDKRIKVFNNKGKGIIDALRLAYAQSDGSLITRMDSDDLMMSNKLSLLKQTLESTGQGHLAVGSVQYFSSEVLGNGYLKYQDWLNHLTQNSSNFQEIYKECVIPSPCWMCYKSDLEKCQAFEPDTYPEDYDLCFRFYEQGLKVVGIQDILHQWRDYPTRSSRTDEHYSDNRFLDLKLHYFLKLDKEKSRPLIVWGAGKKGKLIARKLLEKGIAFRWICNNEKKIGKVIYEQLLHPIDFILQLRHPQIIITVAGDEAQQNILEFLEKNDFKKREDYFFFC